MNSELSHLHPYPFQKIAKLVENLDKNQTFDYISLAIGEPKHPCPELIKQALIDNMATIANYPGTKGLDGLRQTIAQWLIARFNLPEQSMDSDKHILPVNGTREALFAFAQTVVDRQKSQTPTVIMPNPFYQIYEGATLLAGAKPVYLSCDESTGFLPDLDSVSPQTWQDCQLFYMCSPGNPTGAVADAAYLTRLINLAEQYDFVIASDECYSEIYFDESKPPVGLLEVCAQMGNTDYKRCMVFHSLSKRSNAPGLRSGFVAGDASIIEAFLLYRTYHGSAMPAPTQMASIAAWSDEEHVKQNRQQYRQKFDAVLEILSPVMSINRPDAGFYLWPTLEVDDETFVCDMLRDYNLAVVPGSYLARAVNGVNPGAYRTRMALVASIDECIEAANRIKAYLQS